MLPVIAMRASTGSDARRERRALSKKSYTGKNQETGNKIPEKSVGNLVLARFADEAIDDFFRVHALGFGVEVGDDAVVEDGWGDGFEVFE
jgi:hypothetical protein